MDKIRRLATGAISVVLATVAFVFWFTSATSTPPEELREASWSENCAKGLTAEWGPGYQKISMNGHQIGAVVATFQHRSGGWWVYNNDFADYYESAGDGIRLVKKVIKDSNIKSRMSNIEQMECSRDYDPS